MGNATSNPTISEDLTVLGRSDATIQSKEMAFDRLRSHFCRELTHDEQQHALSNVEAQRYPLWPQPPLNSTRLSQFHLQDRIRGLVYGAALGDATGLETEFLTKNDIESYYGPNFPFCPRPTKIFPDTHRMMWRAGDWTDDTDHLVLVLQSLLRTGGIANDRDFASALLRWQTSGFPDLGDDGGAGLGRQTKAVLQRPNFANEPSAVAKRCWMESGASAAANGALMRTAITGVPYFWDEDRIVETTRMVCKTTHADPRCVASCACVAACVAGLLRGEDRAEEGGGGAASVVRRAVDIACKVLQIEGDVAVEEGAWSEVDLLRAEAELRDCANASSLQDLKLDEPSGIGYTFKCLGAALWALCETDKLAGESAEKDIYAAIIREIVSEAGDADTNAAVAGTLIGTKLGWSGLPMDWIVQMPHASWLEAHVQKLLIVARVQ